MKEKTMVLIPAYNPDKCLTELASQLLHSGLPVVVVDDGSTGCEEIFDKLNEMNCTVLRHNKNQGKGRALKTGLSWLLENGCTIVVTADADGQHTVGDIIKTAHRCEELHDKMVLGIRDVNSMPPRSRFGNSLTRRLFKILYGVNLTDTQTGLRAFPLNEHTKKIIALKGEGYEYEMNMLIEACRIFNGIDEVPICTIYEDKNSSSHFRPIADSAKIYAVLFRHFPLFLIISLLSFAVDYMMFALLFYAVFHFALAANILARVFSASFNYIANKNFVFRSKSSSYSPLNYFLLAVCVLAVNSAAIFVLVDVLKLPALYVKITVESIMYVVSFAVQNNMAQKRN